MNSEHWGRSNVCKGDPAREQTGKYVRTINKEIITTVTTSTVLQYREQSVLLYLHWWIIYNVTATSVRNCYICSLLVFNPTAYTRVFLYKHVNSSKENKTIFNSSECQHFILLLQANPTDRLRNKTENSNASQGSFPMKLIFKFILERWYQGQGVLDFIKQYQ